MTRLTAICIALALTAAALTFAAMAAGKGAPKTIAAPVEVAKTVIGKDGLRGRFIEPLAPALRPVV
jgi:hypothetical protein